MMTKYQSDIIRSRVALWRDDRGMPHGDGIFDLYVQDVSLLLAEVDRLTTELKDAEEDATLAETQLSEIVELVGEGGDGSAFGSVESMLATFTHREEMLAKQRDKAEAEVERLTAERDKLIRWREGWLVVDEMCESVAIAAAFARGVAAMREAAVLASRENIGCRHMVCHSCESPAAAIRALPDPEDKS